MPTFAEQQQRAAESQNGVNDFVDPMDLIGDMGFLDAFPSAQNLKLTPEKTVTVNPLTTDDYVPWCAELTQKLQADRLSVISGIKTAKPEELFKMMVNTKETEITPDDVAGLLFRPEWTKRIVMLALAKANIDEPTALLFYKSRPARANEMLGIILSGLWTIARFNAAYEKLMPAGYGPTRTFGGNKSPFANGDASLTPAPSEEGAKEILTGPTPESGSAEPVMMSVS